MSRRTRARTTEQEVVEPSAADEYWRTVDETHAGTSASPLSIPTSTQGRRAAAASVFGPSTSSRRLSNTSSPSVSSTPPISHFVSGASLGARSNPLTSNSTPGFALAGAGGSPSPPSRQSGRSASMSSISQHYQQQRRTRYVSTDAASLSSLTSSSSVTSRQAPSDSLASEWTFFGVDLTVTNVSTLLVAQKAGQLELNTMHDGSSAFSLFSSSFGGDRWKVAIESPATSTEESNSPLTLSLAAHLLDMSFYPNTITTSLMFSVRPAFESQSERHDVDNQIWSVWIDEWHFCQNSNTECWQCNTFPSFEQLLMNERIRMDDAFQLSIQIATPVGAILPLAQRVQPVPRWVLHDLPEDLLNGLRGLLDDKLTSDVIVYTYEQRDDPLTQTRLHGSSSSDITTTADDCSKPARRSHSTQLRLRALYAHTAILTARSTYFRDMLRGGWAETAGIGSSMKRVKGVIKIEDADFHTMYWFLHYLYTDEVKFTSIEDVRTHPSKLEMPSGWLDHVSNWSWKWMTVGQIRERISLEGGACSPLSDRTSTTELDHGRQREQRSPTKSTSLPSSSSSKLPTSSLAAGYSVKPLKPTSSTLTPKSRLIGKSQLSSMPSSTFGANNLTAASLAAQTRSSGFVRTTSSSTTSTTTIKSTPSKSQISSITAGRVSPLTSPVGSNVFGTTSKSSFGEAGVELSGGQAKDEGDPHQHPTKLTEPVSALAMYRLAHHCGVNRLVELSMDHIVRTLTPRTCFPLLLSTGLFPELHEAVKRYALEHFDQVCADPEFTRCYAEVGEGMWDDGGQVLLDFTLRLRPS
ncbi:hypothetical protein OIO90_004863 [Microbotryomycetes sp. JL221]|nr:hypothetical protein OIO90_004863 [Microbotryomycetes sp. JL221]